MDIAVSNNGNNVVVKIVGSISESDGESLKQAFEQVLSAKQANLVLNLSLVPIITSTGIGKIIVLYRKLKSQNRGLKIKGIHQNLYKMFTSINLDKMLEIEK